jgi:ABC-type multidrug transport system fused ATPase/permease subunit
MVCVGLFLAGLLAGAWSFLGLFGLALLVLAARLGWDLLGNETIEKSRSNISSMADLLRGTLLPVRMTHSLGIEGAQLARAEHWVDRLGAARRRTAWMVCVYGATEALSILLIVGAGVVLGWFALRGSGIGMLLAVGAGFCAAGIQFAAMELARLARRSEGVSHLAAELFEFLDERDPPMRPGTRALGPILDSLELDDVCLRDEDSGKRLLAGVTMAIPAGKRIALVSEDPETAHALFAVLARLVEPGSGDIRMDRVNLRSAREDDLRSQVAMVCPADGMLPGTVISNLVAGREIAEPIAIDAAKRVHLDRIVRELPDGYQTIIDGSGNPLTPFARHLLALARAIPGNPSLILWEDPDFPLSPSEAALLDDACRRWFAGKTVLMLARRSATLRHSDKVFFLRGPSLEGFGTHTELMETSPGYRHVVARILVETDRK